MADPATAPCDARRIAEQPMSRPLEGELQESAKLPADGFSQHTVRLAWILGLAYLLVVVYASLHPFGGWRLPPGEILLFLGAPWPRFITLQDILVNVGAYVPLGFLLSVGLGSRYGAGRGALAATLIATAFSLAMESAQMFLPARIASNVDLLANGAGALLGAMAAPLFAPTRILGGRLHAARHRLFVDGIVADAGLVIVLLWLFTQFHPTVQPFGTGYLRATFDLPVYFNHTPGLAFMSEALVVLFNLGGAGLMLSAFMRDGARPMRVIAFLAAAALAIKAYTAAELVQLTAPLAWLTPGVLAGLCGAAAFLYAATRLPSAAQIALAAVCIVAAAAVINLAPENPYQNVPPRLLVRGASHFLSFSGIVRALSELWPALALGYLLGALAGRRR
jgi:VanZ family protein